MEVEKEVLKKFDDSLFLNRISMSLLGIWPLGQTETLIPKRLHRGIVFFFICIILVPQWCDIYILRENVDAIMETMLSNVFIIAVGIKFNNNIKWMALFKETMERMRSNWINVMTKPNTEESQIIFEEVSSTARSLCFKYFLLIYACGTSYVITPFIVNDIRVRKYPFFGWYYFDQSSDNFYYFFFMTQMMTGTVCGIANFATDSIFLVCIYHFCAQLRILQNELLNLGRDGGTNVKEKLATLIRQHQRELRHGRALQTIFSSASSQQLLVSCLMMCANGFKLIVSLNNREFVDFVRYLLLVPLTLLGLLFYCQPGDELIVQSQAIYDAIYKSAWEDMDCDTRRNLILMIQRSQRPLSIRAAKVYVLSLANFMRIMKKSLSGLSVLHAMYVKNN